MICVTHEMGLYRCCRPAIFMADGDPRISGPRPVLRQPLTARAQDFLFKILEPL